MPSALEQTDRIYRRTVKAHVDRIKGALWDYEPVNEKAEQFHNSTASTRCLFCANQSGKSTTARADVAAFMQGTHPLQLRGLAPMPPLEWRVVTLDYPTLEKHHIPEYKKLVNPLLLRGGCWEKAFSSRNLIVHYKDGGFIEHMSYEQDVDKFAAVQRDGTWFDEEPPRAIWDECQMRHMRRKGRNILTMTPDNGCTWVWDTFDLPWQSGTLDPNVECWRWSLYENKFISREEVDKKSAGLDEVTRRIKIFGEFMSRSGLIFGAQYWNPRAPWTYNAFDIPKEWPVWVGIDTSNRKPTAVVFLAVSPSGERWVFDEIYHGPGPMQKIADMIRVKLRGREPQGYLIDWSSKGQDAEYGVSYYDDLINCGVPVTLALKDPRDRIGRLWRIMAWDPALKSDHPQAYDKNIFPAEATGGPRLHVCAQTCKMLVWQLSRYVWDDFVSYKTADRRDQPDRPRKKDDDLVDALGYIEMESPAYFVRPPAQDPDDHWSPREEEPSGTDAWWSGDYGKRGWRAA